jgi:hypothetical protein
MMHVNSSALGGGLVDELAEQLSRGQRRAGSRDAECLQNVAAGAVLARKSTRKTMVFHGHSF